MNNKRKRRQEDENHQQNKITRYMKPNEQQQHDETTTTTECDNQQQQHTVRKLTKLMVKAKGLEITDMKKFLEGKRRDHAVLLENEQSKPNSAELHTQQKFCKIQRAQRTDGMRGRNELDAMGNSATNGD